MNPIEFMLYMIFLMQIVILFDPPYEINNKHSNNVLLLCNKTDTDCVIKYLY